MKNTRALSLLLSANAVSGFSQGISMLAIPWYFSQQTDSMSAFGLAYAVITLGSMFWSLYAGTLIDRYSRKNIFLLLNLICGFFLAAVAVYGYRSGEVPVPLIIFVFGLTIFNFNIHYPAVYAFGQEISDKQDYGRFNSLAEIQGQATSVISGAIAAMLLSGTKGGEATVLGITLSLPFRIEPWTLKDIFLLNAATYFLAAVFIAFIPYAAVKKTVLSEPVWHRIKEGFSFLKKHPALMVFGNASFSIFVVLIVEVQLLLPLYVDRHLNAPASVYASAEMFYAVGALLAGLFIRKVFKTVPTVQAILWLMGITAAGFMSCTFSASVLFFYLFSFAIGITNAGARVLRITWLFEHIPNHIIGRTSSVFQMINILIRFVITMIFSIPFFVAENNVIWSYFICGVIVAVSMIPLWKNYRVLQTDFSARSEAPPSGD